MEGEAVEQEVGWTVVGETRWTAFGLSVFLMCAFPGKEVDEPDREADGEIAQPKGKRERKKKRARKDDVEDGPSHKAAPADSDVMARFGAEGEFDDQRTVFAGGVPYQANREDIIRFFSEAGVVSRVRMLQYRGKSNGACFVEMATPAEAHRAAALDGELFLQRPVRVNLATEKPGSQKGVSVYVGNLAFTTSEKLLRAIFGHCGDIVNVKMPLFHDSGKLRGFAIVDLDSEASRQRAIKLNGMKVEGREIRVEVMNKPAPEETKKKAIPAFRRSEEEKHQQKKKAAKPFKKTKK